jgi:hypothetical protein
MTDVKKTKSRREKMGKRWRGRCSVYALTFTASERAIKQKKKEETKRLVTIYERILALFLFRGIFLPDASSFFPLNPGSVLLLWAFLQA